MACYLSTPFLIFPILKGESRVIFTNFHNAHPLTRPHPRAVRRKVIIISNCRLVPYWREFLGVSGSRTRSDLPFANTYRLARRALNRLSYQDRQENPSGRHYGGAITCVKIQKYCRCKTMYVPCSFHRWSLLRSGDRSGFPVHRQHTSRYRPGIELYNDNKIQSFWFCSNEIITGSGFIRSWNNLRTGNGFITPWNTLRTGSGFIRPWNTLRTGSGFINYKAMEYHHNRKWISEITRTWYW